MPWVIVFRLKGGPGVTCDGCVERPFAAVTLVVGCWPFVGVVVVAARPLGETSGEKTPPIAYSDRLNPYCLARWRLTSRISTSMTTSAFGLSFCAIIFSRICATLVDARTVIVLLALFTWMIGCTGIPGSLMI